MDAIEITQNNASEIIVSHPDLKAGVGFLALSTVEAREFAARLLGHVAKVETDLRIKLEEQKRKVAEAIPVDRTKRVLTDGSPETEDHRDIIRGGVRDGQYNAYIVLSEEERGKGFVRPFRDTYTHKPCGKNTTMGLAIAETYARDPGFYSGTFCFKCKKHFPLAEFVWAGTNEQVGS